MNNGAQGGMSLYHNLGGGRFEEATSRAVSGVILHGTGCAIGDYDNDGFADMAVASTNELRLFHNEKNGTFKPRDLGLREVLARGVVAGTQQTGQDRGRRLR